jgi:NADPH:quinone reductase-like Zn-dependent oxidoreductase
MKQIVITKYGGPDVLKLQESKDPTPSAGEVLINVKAIGVNFADILARKGKNRRMDAGNSERRGARVGSAACRQNLSVGTGR